MVELVDGTYRLTAPLIFTDADSGANGHTNSWQAATGAHPVLSGGKQITGWAVSDSGKNIWKATAPGTFATRQLYVDGTIAARSSHSISRNGMSHDNATFPLNSGVSFLNNAAQANHRGPRARELDGSLRAGAIHREQHGNDGAAVVVQPDVRLGHDY